jgi:hypothetical protein
MDKTHETVVNNAGDITFTFYTSLADRDQIKDIAIKMATAPEFSSLMNWANLVPSHNIPK